VTQRDGDGAGQVSVHYRSATGEREVKEEESGLGEFTKEKEGGPHVENG
jgi:hypothetical protein